MEIYIIQDRETGTEMEVVYDIKTAIYTLLEFEEQDKENGEYTPDFYEIKVIDTQTCEHVILY